jgi:hypothetical protein
MGNHRSKTANISGFYLTHNMLLGLNELKYSLSLYQPENYQVDIGSSEFYAVMPKIATTSIAFRFST